MRHYLKNFDLKEYHITTIKNWETDYPFSWQAIQKIKLLGEEEYPIPKDYKEV